MSTDFHKMSDKQLTAVLYSACFNWGASKTGSILEIQALYREFARRIGEQERLMTVVKLAQEAREHGSAFNALVPFMWEDPSISVVITATIELASSAPAESEDELTGPRIAVGMIENADNLPELNRAGMIKGLLLLGDMRILKLVGEAWRYIDGKTLVPFLMTGSQFVYLSWIEFLVRWCEAVVDPETDGCYGAVAHVLYQIPEALALAMEEQVLDVERPYPITLGEIRRIGEWTLPQVATKYKRRLEVLAARETSEPVLMERVIEAWGLASPED